jgi:hypothetical protein
MEISHDAPRAVLRRQTITLEITACELHDLIEAINAKAVRAAAFPDQVGYADYLFQRVAQLREAGR